MMNLFRTCGQWEAEMAMKDYMAVAKDVNANVTPKQHCAKTLDHTLFKDDDR